MMDRLLITLGAGLLFFGCFAPLESRDPARDVGYAPETSSPAKSGPNILFILTDDQGIGDLSLHGNDSIRTPNMDALLRSSARFDRFYVDPVCAPTRASFLSGLYAPRTGSIYVTRRRETMDSAVKTLAEHLTEAGYRTALFGKWHNGATFPYHPAGQGFQEFLGFTMGHFNDYFDGILRNERDEPVPFHGELTDLLTDSASHWMTTGEQPFLSVVAYQGPHTPIQVGDDHWDAVAERGLSPFNTGIYAMVESIDEQLGRLLEELDTAGKLDNTIVVFATDNGPNGDRYRQGLRGWKTMIDEGGVRVPFGIRLPGDHPANGRVFSTPAAHVDLLPTLLDYLELPVPDQLDGTSLRPLLEGGTLPHRYLYTFRQAFVFDPDHGSMRDSNYVYLRRTAGVEELYDLNADPGQGTDLLAELPEVAERMRSDYDRVSAGIHRKDRVAPPIRVGGGAIPVRLVAHEGEPRGQTTFSRRGGFANDYLVGVDTGGVVWPVDVTEPGSYAVTIHYHLEGSAPREISLGTDGTPPLTAYPSARPERATPDGRPGGTGRGISPPLAGGDGERTVPASGSGETAVAGWCGSGALDQGGNAEADALMVILFAAVFLNYHPTVRSASSRHRGP